MNPTMSLDQYRREVRDPAIKKQMEFDPWLRKLISKRKEQNEKLAKKAKGILVKLPAEIVARRAGGWHIVEGKDMVESFKGLKDPDKPERQHIEDDHTEMVAGYLELLMMQGKVVEYTHTANETYTRSPMQKARNTKMGVRSGIPDIVVVFPHTVLFLEMKRPDGGVVSPTQKKWITALKAVGGPVQCEVANGYDEAKVIIDRILSEQNT